MSTRLQEKRQQDPGVPFTKTRGYPSGFLRRLPSGEELKRGPAWKGERLEGFKRRPEDRALGGPRDSGKQYSREQETGREFQIPRRPTFFGKTTLVGTTN
ncbi:hypothetical protein ALC53_12891 [Atta colombica]|uniref:Uncharacterized protein n=1 Tax=Atta colombica TaxID=520822 RepID=A0A151HYE3_9HYME|nr:hypothetical protein ALC53_12891 [Atta colombica]